MKEDPEVTKWKEIAIALHTGIGVLKVEMTMRALNFEIQRRQATVPEDVKQSEIREQEHKAVMDIVDRIFGGHRMVEIPPESPALK